MWRAKMRSLYEDVRWMRGCWLSNLAASRTPKLRSKRTSPRPAANSVPHRIPLKFPQFARQFLLPFFFNQDHQLKSSSLPPDSCSRLPGAGDSDGPVESDLPLLKPSLRG